MFVGALRNHVRMTNLFWTGVDGTTKGVGWVVVPGGGMAEVEGISAGSLGAGLRDGEGNGAWFEEI